MIVIFEGVSKTGKTSTISELKKNMNEIKIIEQKKRLCPEQVSQLSEIILYSQIYNYALLDIMSLIDKNEIFIMDRFHISEFVYNYTYKRLTFQDTFNNFQNYEQELIKIKHAILIVYLYARPDIIVNRFIEENENFEKSKDLFDLIKNYNFILKKTIFNYITIDTSSKEFLNKNVKEIIKTISDIKNK